MEEAHLRSIPLFAELSKRELREVAQRADEVDVKEGRVLVREGEFAHEFFAILEGTAEVRHGDEHVADLGPGDFFGDMALVAHARRNANVVAKSPMRAIVMTGWDFRDVRRDIPSVAERIHAAVEERSRALQAR